MVIQNLKEQERQDLNIDDKSGVKIISVDPGSFADDIGLQEGDAIVSINRQPVATPADVMKVQASLKPGQAVAVHIVRSAVVSGQHSPPERYYLSGKLPQE